MELNKSVKVSLDEYPKYSPLPTIILIAEDTLVEGDLAQKFFAGVQ